MQQHRLNQLSGMIEKSQNPVHKVSGHIVKPPFFLQAYKFLLLGYSLFGRSFAYLGVPPLFIGEIFLGWGLLRAPIAQGLSKLFSIPAFVLLFFFVSYCAGLTLVSSLRYDVIDTLRDGVIWGYAIFGAVIASYCLRTPNLIVDFLKSYSWFAVLYIFTGPILAVLNGYLFGRVPNIPGTIIPILTEKSGDVEVHLAGILAFAYLGFRRLRIVELGALLFGVLAMATLSRGGFLSVVCAVILLSTFKPRFKFIIAVLGTGIVVLTFFSFIDFEAQVFGRTISTTQLVNNIFSIVGSTGDPYDLGGTREWRLNWWKQIIDYTFGGDHFWFGKGFGINLAADDGIIDLSGDNEPLRSPHNSHLTFLARGGVPLFFFWIILQLSWALGMVRMIFRARSRGEDICERVGIFLLTYWVAMIVNMSFDVYLEGPMGGIWFWTIWGYGLALMWLHRYRPQSLAVLASVGKAASSRKLMPQPAE